MKIQKITKEEFNIFYKRINPNPLYDEDFLYNLLNNIIDYYNNEVDVSVSDNFSDINPYSVFLYLYAEYNYCVQGKSEEEILKFNNDIDSLDALSSIALDKYLTNEKIDLNEKYFANKFSPSISTLTLYLNFMNKVNLQFSKNNPFITLISDILMKCIKISKCTLELLTNGFEAEAFSTWRTLHETECVLRILIKYKKPVITSYLKHLTYSLAYRKLIKNPDRTNEIFEEIKKEMKVYNLKSKDMKKYIEYGYLLAIDEFKLEDNYKLNFRDGVEKMAGLENYSKTYEYSSEIAHSSPLMIYSNEQSLFHLTLISLYEVFFRIEQIFSSHLLSLNENKEFKERYLKMRQVYYYILVNIYNKEKEIYYKLTNHKTF